MAGAEEEKGKQRSQKRGQEEMGLGMMGQRQVTPRLVNYTVWLHDGSIRENSQWQVRATPQTEIRRRAEKGGSG